MLTTMASPPIDFRLRLFNIPGIQARTCSPKITCFLQEPRITELIESDGVSNVFMKIMEHSITYDLSKILHIRTISI